MIYIFTLYICRSTFSHLHTCISTFSHPHICRSTSSHLHICRSPFALFLVSLKAAAVSSERHETQPCARNGRWTSKTQVKLWFEASRAPQPFRTKWTLEIKNWRKIATLKRPSQPFHTKWTLDVKNWRKIATLRCPSQPFHTKWTLDVKNWRKIASLRCPSQPFSRQKLKTNCDLGRWTSKNWGNFAILLGQSQPLRAKSTLDAKNCEKLRLRGVHRNSFGRNGRWTSKTDGKLRWTLSFV